MDPLNFLFCRRGALVLALAGGALAATGGGALPAATFVRGDSNGDGDLDISDPIILLGHLFSGTASIPCPDAADVDDSGRMDISDAIGILGFLYLGGESPREPYPAAGFDPSPDQLDCEGEPDSLEDLSGAGLDGWEEDRTEIEGWTALEESGAAGEALFLDAATFEALLALESGQPVQAALGGGTEPFLADFFRGELPPAGDPPAFAVDAVVPADPGGCFRIPPALIDARSQRDAAGGRFRRGDVDGDGLVNLRDSQVLAECLDGASPCPDHCWDAADANDDGEVDSADTRAILQASLGASLPPPGALCGTDPTPGGLPPCSAGWCAGLAGRTLIVRPEVICGLGPHPVELISIEEDGSEERGQATVTLCAPGVAGCPEGPLAKPPDVPSEPGLICRWIAALDLDPEDKESDFRQIVYDGGGGILATRHSLPMVGTRTAMEIYRTEEGPGPVHYLYLGRTEANCSTPPTQHSFVKSGTLQVRVGIFCIRTDGSNSTIHCDGQAEVEGIYDSRVEASTSAGADCRNKPNSVDSLAQDESQLKANEQTLFSKAVAVQNGNEVTTHPSFSTQFGASYGKEGLAANAGINFGYSSTRTNRTGRSADLLQAFGNAKLDLPLTVILWAKGKIEMSAFHRTSSSAKCATRVAGVWLVAKTDCPIDGSLFLSHIRGEDDEIERAKKMADQFRATRMGN